VGSLRLHFGHQKVENYVRDLDLQTAVSTTSYTCDNVQYTRRVIASLADGIVVVNVKASKKGALNFTLSHKCIFPMEAKASSNQLLATIKGVDQEGVRAALTAQCLTRVKADGTTKAEGDSLVVAGATEATLYISAATNFVNYHDVSGDAAKKNEQFLAAADKMKFDQLLKRHLAVYQKQYNRVNLSLASSDNQKLPTDQRLDKFYGSSDLYGGQSGAVKQLCFFHACRKWCLSPCPLHLEGSQRKVHGMVSGRCEAVRHRYRGWS
jgi:alpha-L-fucosidase 2